MQRRLFNLLTLQSLVLFAAALLWPGWGVPVSGTIGLPSFQTREGLLFDMREVHQSQGPVVWYYPSRRLHFFVAAAAAVLPIGWCVIQIRQSQNTRRRRTSGRCAFCGYDLRATPDRCPECGASPYEVR